MVKVYTYIDALTDGWQRGELILIAARPSVGKTALGINIAQNAASNEFPVGFVSIEQADREIALRLLASNSQVNSLVLRRGGIKDQSEQSRSVLGAYNRLHSLPIFINDSGRQTIRSIGAHCRKMKATKGISLMIVDYIQIVTSDSRNAPRHEQVSEISRGLKLLARELEIPIIALAQLNRKTEDRNEEEPKLSDLKDSGSLEQDADVVILMHRLKKPDTNAPTEKIQARIAKQRNGPTMAVTLTYVKSAMRFDNYAEGIPQ